MTAKKSGRYLVLSEEGEFEPGSRNKILKNLLGIYHKREMDIAESASYDKVTLEALNLFDNNHRFTASDICKLHKLWLGGIYSWSGEYRSVNMSKEGFQFASAHLIPNLMR